MSFYRSISNVRAKEAVEAELRTVIAMALIKTLFINLRKN